MRPTTMPSFNLGFDSLKHEVRVEPWLVLSVIAID
jgi:hypothetical protein